MSALFRSDSTLLRRVRYGVTTVALSLPLVGMTVLAGCGGSSSPLASPDSVSGRATSPPTSTSSNAPVSVSTSTSTSDDQTRAAPAPSVGGGLPDLTSDEQTRFLNGLAKFKTIEDAGDGLGPVFNGKSCAECHSAGAVGGANFDLVDSRVTRIGAMVHGIYSDLTNVGGPTIQRRSLQEIDPKNPVPPEYVPKEAQFISHRIATPLFGAGLIENIPDAALKQEANQNQRDPDCIGGRVNLIVNAETGATEVGKFGWKAQISSLRVFAADAYLNEMGVTTPIFPTELLPQGKPIPPGAENTKSPEDDGGDVVLFSDFMRFLAPPAPLPSNPRIQHGEMLFQQVRCAACHTPTLMTQASTSRALSRKRVNLYSDLLLHDLGSGLADGIQQGNSKGSEFRTAPLWGTHLRQFFLHDGSASSVEQALQMHGGQSRRVMERYSRLKPTDRADLVAFVKSL